MSKGRVKWFSPSKGYGFLTDEESGKDVFVHYTGIVGADSKKFKSLADGAEVTFDTEEGAKGIQACNVVQV